MTAQTVAKILYEEYHNALNSLPYPSWEELQADKTKATQENAWITVAEAAIVLYD